jgi:WD40 repeat protein
VLEAGAVLAHYADDVRPLLITGSSTSDVVAWTPKGDRILEQKLSAPLTALGLSRAADVVAAAAEDGSVCLWTLSDGQLRAAFKSRYPAGQIHFSADGSRVLTAGWTRAAPRFSLDGEPLPRVHLEIRDIASANRLYECDLGNEVTSFAVSSDWRRVLAGHESGQMALWDLLQGREVARFVGHKQKVRSVTLSPDGRFALSGASDTWVIFWGLPAVDGE